MDRPGFVTDFCNQCPYGVLAYIGFSPRGGRKILQRAQCGAKNDGAGTVGPKLASLGVTAFALDR